MGQIINDGMGLCKEWLSCVIFSGCLWALCNFMLSFLASQMLIICIIIAR